MDNAAFFDRAFAAFPLVAILRGVRPGEVIEIAEVLVETGFRLVEVPLNSPEPFESIARLQSRLGGRALIGAGTVTSIDEVQALQRIGAGLAVSPHCDPDVIKASRAAGLVSLPGILTPSEAFSALRAGANGLKLFPMEMIGPSGVKAMRAVLPRATRCIAVGGVHAGNLAELSRAGCDGFGLGSTIYRPGDTAARVREQATALRDAWHSYAR